VEEEEEATEVEEAEEGTEGSCPVIPLSMAFGVNNKKRGLW
jgi:hypothetical protein